MKEIIYRLTIRENYKNYSPPKFIYPVVRKLLNAIPKKFLVGLGSIVLTNFDARNITRRSRKTWSHKKKIPAQDYLGIYHHKGKVEPAYIEIFIEKALYQWPKSWLWLSIVQDVAISSVLYHEIGHHIHRTKFPELNDPENVAKEWEEKLWVHYCKKKYWYFVKMLYPYFALRRLLTDERQLGHE